MSPPELTRKNSCWLHLLIRPLGDSSLSDILKWLLGVYTMAYNRIHKQWGHVWGGRYFSRPIVTFKEYVEVYRYIDQNPVKAGLVDLPSDWHWSGLAHQLKGRKDIVSSPLWWRGVVSDQPIFLVGIPWLGSDPQ